MINWKSRPILWELIILICIICAGSGNAAAQDPLNSASAYSLGINDKGWNYNRYFPLGILAPRDLTELVQYGFDFTETNFDSACIISNHAYPLPQAGNSSGILAALWSQHGLWHNASVKGYGDMPKAIKADGTAFDNHYVSVFDPNVRRFILDADATLVKNLGAKTRPVMMWSQDNELEGYLDYSPSALKLFAEWLKKAYGSIENLNSAWNTKYAHWEEATPPAKRARISQPAAWLDWQSFQTSYFTEFMAERHRNIFEADPYHRPTISKTTQLTVAVPAKAKERAFDPAMYAELTRKYSGWYGADAYGEDDNLCFTANYLYQCIRPLDIHSGGHLILPETNGSVAGWEWASTMWRMISNGVKGYDFFCGGVPGASGDWQAYAMTGMDGSLGAKMVYASLLTGSIRRSEDFWSQCIPAYGVPKVAIYLSRNDVILANDTSEWGLPDNNPLNVYTALRDQGYWVDVIPHTKLNAQFLRQYNALVLVGARHLTKDNCKAITDYVQSGGVLMGDVLSGYYDEHHRVTGGLEKLFGVQTGALKDWDNWNLLLPDGIMRCYQSAPVKPMGAIVCAVNHRNEPAVFKRKVGKGQAIYISGILGGLQNNVPQGNDLVGSWLAQQLKRAEVKPAYRLAGAAASLRRIRVESPWIDTRGNVGITIGTMGIESHKAVSIVLRLPKGNWRNALWAPASTPKLLNVNIAHLQADEYRVDLPAFKAAGMLLLFNHHDPLIAVEAPGIKNIGIETPIPVIPAGKPVAIKVRLINASDTACPSGKIRLMALKQWKIAPSVINTPAISAHGMFEAIFNVTAPAYGLQPANERMYPLVARWSDSKIDRAVGFTTVGASPNESTLPKLLSDNIWLPDGSKRKIHTGATYRYIVPGGSIDKLIADPASSETDNPTPALQNGLGNWDKSARINSSDVLVDFDLKSVYKIAEIKVHCCPICQEPQNIEYLLSNDGTNYTSVGTFTGDGSQTWGKWFDLALSHTSARFVRLKVHFNYNDGNYLDEVEIWGR